MSASPLPAHWFVPNDIKLILWLVMFILLLLPILLYNSDDGIREVMDANSIWFEPFPFLIGGWFLVTFWLGYSYRKKALDEYNKKGHFPERAEKKVK